MRGFSILLLLVVASGSAEGQVFNDLIGTKICWSNGRSAIFLPNGDFIEDGKKAGSWAHLAGDTIDWSSYRTGRGAVEFTKAGGSIIVKFAGRTLSGKICK